MIRVSSDFESTFRYKPDNEIDALERLEKSRKIENLMRSDPTGEYSNLEPELIYNYGRISGVARDTNEILHHK